MKIVFYNLGYGRGHDGSVRGYVSGFLKFFWQSRKSQKRVLGEIRQLIANELPDVFAYAEISTGSFKNQHFNQHKYLVNSCGGHHTESAVSKYGETFVSSFPFHAGNANGVISFVPARIKEIYLQKSRKRLVYKIEAERLTIFTVHLPLVSTDRKAQLHELGALVNECATDVVVCGDFNIIDGIDELDILKRDTNLQIAGDGLKTFPACNPKKNLDVFMYRFKDDAVLPRMRTVDMSTSDHLPIVLEW